MICFNSYCDSGTGDDCIHAPLPDAGTPVGFFSGSYDSALESKVTSDVTTITEPMNCSVFIEYQYMSHTVSTDQCHIFSCIRNTFHADLNLWDSLQVTVSLISFGTRAAMGLEYSSTTSFTVSYETVNQPMSLDLKHLTVTS